MTGEMPEKTRQLFLLFKDAVERERGAQSLYKRAAELCEDETLRGLFEGFYKDELRHEKMLLARYKRLRKEHNVQGK